MSKYKKLSHVICRLVYNFWLNILVSVNGLFLAMVMNILRVYLQYNFIKVLKSFIDGNPFNKDALQGDEAVIEHLKIK